MKTLGIKMLSMLFMFFGAMVAMGQQQMEVPGDYFSLEGALELFKKSSSPEEFERLLNSPDSKVNNLDLNGDGMVDYIRVIDRNEGNVHAFIIQALLSDRESQDVAVIELEKLANGKAILQITGDEDVYGVETIIEPTEEVRVYAGTTTSSAVVNVWTWPVVQYVYSPYYTVWVSPWYWSFRPVWWVSWRPITYVDYYSYWRPYRSYYSFCYTHRIVYARDIYRPYRTYSRSYHDRHHTQLVSYRQTHRDHKTHRDRYDGYHKPRNGYADNRDYNRNDRDQRPRNNDQGDNRGKYNRGNDNRGNGNNNGVGKNNNRGNSGTIQRNRYTDQRTGKDRYDAGKDGRDNTNLDRNSTGRKTYTPSRTYTPDRSQGNVQERRSSGTNQRTYAKPEVGQRSNQPQQNRSVERMSRGSQQRESKSYHNSSRGNANKSGVSKGSNNGSGGNGKRGKSKD